MNIFSKISNLRYYIKTIKENERELEEKFNVKVDNIYRLYTVYDINPKEYEQYGGNDKIMINSDNKIETFLEQASASHMPSKIMNGEDLFNKKVDAELFRLEKFLMSKGLAEMYGMSQKKREDEFNYSVVVEYKFLSTKFLANLAILSGLTLLGSVVLGSIIGSFLLFM
tara:strand:+ start:63 stop:569 length:507 start_codon:yes stop_codon:yes gene_type:complete